MIELSEQDAKLTKYNPRPELHGQDPTPAADVKFEFNAAAADVLPMLDPTLRSFLFCKNGAVQHDLASQAHDAPDLRYPKMATPIEWGANLEDAKLTIHRGIGGKSDLVLPAKMKKPIQLAPQQGGTVIVTMQVQCHPDERAAGSLYMLMGQKVSISFEPGDEGGSDDGGEGEGGEE